MSHFNNGVCTYNDVSKEELRDEEGDIEILPLTSLTEKKPHHPNPNSSCSANQK